MKRTLILILTFILLFTSISTVFVSANFGSGVAVATSEAKVIKTAIYGKKLTISDLDIKQALCINDFKKITITRVPKSTEGAIMMGGRRISDGVSVNRKNIPALVFIPASKEVSEARFYFTVDGYMDGAEIEFLIRYTDKINYEPKINTEEETLLKLNTQREIGVYSKMSATDSENDRLEYMILEYPKYGSITVLNKESGEYLYTPPYSFVGTDSFTYVCRDEWGNFSTTCTVNINIDERMSEVVYADMTDRREYSASVAMSAMGIMSGEIMGDNMYFNPDKSVSKAEFVAMAMKTAGVKSNSKLTASFFDDDAQIPAPLRSYIATAQRIGIIHGEFSDGKLVFNPNSPITKYEAAVVMSKLLNKEIKGEVPVFNDSGSIPSWAKDAVYVMVDAGIFQAQNGSINPKDTVKRGECAEYLYRLYNSK